MPRRLQSKGDGKSGGDGPEEPSPSPSPSPDASPSPSPDMMVMSRPDVTDSLVSATASTCADSLSADACAEVVELQQCEYHSSICCASCAANGTQALDLIGLSEASPLSETSAVSADKSGVSETTVALIIGLVAGGLAAALVATIAFRLRQQRTAVIVKGVTNKVNPLPANMVTA